MNQQRLLSRAFPIFRMALGSMYFIGFLLHALDVMNLRLNFSEMDSVWKSWILFLLIFDLVASIGLILKKIWGEIVFVIIAIAQLIAYIGFSSFFGDQNFLIIFHLACLFIYAFLKRFDLQRALAS